MLNEVKSASGGQKITLHLWFDTQAKEATEFYTSIFPHSKVNTISTIHNTSSGDCDVVSFELAGQSFMAISVGPYFKLIHPYHF